MSERTNFEASQRLNQVLSKLGLYSQTLASIRDYQLQYFIMG